MYNIVRTKNIWFAISIILAGVSIAYLALGGLKFGIDFTGGALMKIKFTAINQPVESNVIQSALIDLSLGELQIQEAEGQFNIKAKDLSNDDREQILTTLREKIGEVEEQSFESIGPTIGTELKKKAIIAIVLVLIAIILYITWAFRKVSSGPVPSYVFGVAAVIALAHDILITTGVFAALGYYQNVEIGTLFITALLTILGFSVHDTIVIFDRIRETLNKKFGAPFSEIINQSINETMVRSLNTSITTLLVLVALALFGGESIYYFVLALIIGIILGTYSSIFIASPLLLVWQKLKK